MREIFKRSWFLLLMRGVLAVIFGLVLLILPNISLYVIIFIFAIFAVAEGVVSIIESISKNKVIHRWWFLLIAGFISVGFGIFAFVYPKITLLILIYLIGIRAFILGIIEISNVIRKGSEIEEEWFLILTGVLSILFSIVIFFRPDIGLAALITILSIYAIFYGFILIILSIRIKRYSIK
jgi:uncharacterized membrane protein HdeD (DUF308 family)